MQISQKEYQALRDCMDLMVQPLHHQELRLEMGKQLLKLLNADYFASYIWNSSSHQFEQGVWLEMNGDNLSRYEQHYQFVDPITLKLQEKRSATLVTEILPQKNLIQTEFYNDFLKKDGLHWGINLHAFQHQNAVADLRIWRQEKKLNFGLKEKQILNLIEPLFVKALASELKLGSNINTLSQRELAVARCIQQGKTDKEIAQQLKIEVSSVRTYINRIFEKLKVQRRSAIASLMD
jgi:DNA-binding CsgD family transcriptional regulator